MYWCFYGYKPGRIGRHCKTHVVESVKVVVFSISKWLKRLNFMAAKKHNFMDRLPDIKLKGLNDFWENQIKIRLQRIKELE